MAEVDERVSPRTELLAEALRSVPELYPVGVDTPHIRALSEENAAAILATPAFARLVALDRAELAAAGGIDVERLARARFANVPPERHGQLCPVWVRRKGDPAPGWDACDCWQRDWCKRSARADAAEYVALIEGEKGADQ